MVAELLYLEKQGTSLPIEMLINSSGTTRQDGEIVSRKAVTWKCWQHAQRWAVQLQSNHAAATAVAAGGLHRQCALLQGYAVTSTAIQQQLYHITQAYVEFSSCLGSAVTAVHKDANVLTSSSTSHFKVQQQ
jgi:hypothetical protein